MGQFFSITAKNPYNLCSCIHEKFILNNFKDPLESKTNIDYNLESSDLLDLLMMSPESFLNIESVIEYLILHQNKEDIKIEHQNLIQRHKKCKNLADLRTFESKPYKILGKSLFDKINEMESKHIYKKFGSNEEYTFIFFYSYLLKELSTGLTKEEMSDISHINNEINDYGIQSNFGFITETDLIDNPNFSGIPLSNSFHVHGMASNGNFLFLLGSDLKLTIFPIIENGALNMPISNILNDIESNPDMSIGFFPGILFINTPFVENGEQLGSETLYYDIANIIYHFNSTPETHNFFDQLTLYLSNVPRFHKTKEIIITDGIINVYLDFNFNFKLKSVNNDEVIYHSRLQKSTKSNLHESLPNITDQRMLSCPCETNGVVLSFYIKVDNNHILCRQFSLLDGMHLCDNYFESSLNIISVTYDSINEMHYALLKENGRNIVRSFSSFSCINPFVFGLIRPNINEIDEFSKFLSNFSKIMLSSNFAFPDDNFILPDLNSIVSILYLLVEFFKNNTCYQENKYKDHYILSIIQTVIIFLVRNIKYILSKQKSEKELLSIQKGILDFIYQISENKMKFGVNIISFVIINLLDLVFDASDTVFQEILKQVLLEAPPTLYYYMIKRFENSLAISKALFINKQSCFNEYFVFPSNSFNDRIYAFLFANQKCIINQTLKEIKNDVFSNADFSHIIHEKSNSDSCLDIFCEYSSFVINEFVQSLSSCGNFDDLKISTIYLLFQNFILLILGLSDYHSVSQILTPLFYVIPTALKDFFVKTNIDYVNDSDAQNLFIHIGFTIGAFAGTLIKGGQYSSFDENFKWLIRPNMHFIENIEALKNIDQQDNNNFLDKNIDALLTTKEKNQECELKKKLRIIYKHWKPAMNKNINDTLIQIDELFLASCIFHLNLFETINDLSEDKSTINKYIDMLRPSLEQMIRIRNLARKKMRDGGSIDDYMAKCRMLLRMNSQFQILEQNSNKTNELIKTNNQSTIMKQNSEYSKCLADFVLSSHNTGSFKNYIMNQQHRLKLTNIGFSLLEATYSIDVDIFQQSLATSLSLIDNFDGLSSIIQYDATKTYIGHILKFLDGVIKNNRNPHLLLVAHKLMKSGAAPYKNVSNLIKFIYQNSFNNTSFFALSYNRVGYIEDFFDDITDLNKLNYKEWFFISNSLSTNKCPDKLFSMLYYHCCNLAENSNVESNIKYNRSEYQKYIHFAFDSLFNAIKHSELNTTIAECFSFFLIKLGINIMSNSKVMISSEIIRFFRKILKLFDDFSNCLFHVFEHLEKNISNMTAIFSILGGDIDTFKKYSTISYIESRGKFKNGIILNYNHDNSDVIHTPIGPESVVIKGVSNRCILSEPIETFNCLMYPNFQFVYSYFDVALSHMNIPLCPIYLRSLSSYLSNDFIDTETVSHFIHNLITFTNPCDSLYETLSLFSYISQYKINELNNNLCDFDEVSNNGLYISPVFNRENINQNLCRIKIKCTQNFEGFFGIIPDTLIENPPSLLIYPHIGFVAPQMTEIEITSSNEITFTYDIKNNSILYNDMRFNFKSNSNRIYNYRIIVSSAESCIIKIINKKDFNFYHCSDNFELNDKNKTNSFLSPPLELINLMTPKTIINYPKWVKQNNQNLINKLQNFTNVPPFQPIVNQPELFNFYQTQNPFYFLKDGISENVKQNILIHIYQKLSTQWSTILVMKLINIISKDELVSIFDDMKDQFTRYFSFMQVPLEFFDNRKLENGIFPFYFDENENIVSEGSTQVTVNFQIQDEMKRCAQTLLNLPNFKYCLEKKIKDMLNNTSVHLLSDEILNSCFYSPFFAYTSHYTISFNNNKSRVYSPEYLIIALPKFNLFTVHEGKVSDCTSTEPNFKNESYPFILDRKKSNTFLLDLKNFDNDPRFFLGLAIDKWSNKWVYGTSFELLLLIKQYYLSFDDHSFIKSVLLDIILMNSPFIQKFMLDCIIKIYNDSFLYPFTTIENSYLQKVVYLTSLERAYSEKIDPIIFSIVYQEKRAICSEIRISLSPCFPEFHKNQSINKNVSNTDKLIIIKIPNLDIEDTNDIMGQILTFKELMSERNSIEGYPYWEALPIWLAITNDLQKTSYIDPQITITSNKDGILEVSNPNSKHFILTLKNSGIETSINSLLVISSYSPMFDDESTKIINDIFCPIKASTKKLFISCMDIQGNITFRVQSSLKYRINNHKMIINTKEFHDDFLNEMKQLVEHWKPSYTNTILNAISLNIISNKEFNPIKETILSLPQFQDQNSEINVRLALFVGFIIHRANYFYLNYRKYAPISFWKYIQFLLSCQEAANDFLRSLVEVSSRKIRITIDRHDARQYAMEPVIEFHPRSIIFQFSKIVMKRPYYEFQSAEIPWKVTFKNELAIDAGGPSHELFSEIATSIFEPSSFLFIPSPNHRNCTGVNRDTFIPFNRSNVMNKAFRARQYKAIGVFIGVVIRTGIPQSLPFAPIVWKALANERIQENDVFEIDNRLKEFLTRIRKAKNDVDFTERFNINWTIENWDGSVLPISNPTNRSIVTGDLVERFAANCIRARIEILLSNIHYIRLGFYENIGFSSHISMTGTVISLLAQGSNIITTEQLKQITIFDVVIRQIPNLEANYWKAVSMMTNEQRSLLLKFITTLPRLPNPAINKDFNITVLLMSNSDEGMLPVAATCFNKLILPPYSSAEIAYQKITMAIEACQTMENY